MLLSTRTLVRSRRTGRFSDCKAAHERASVSAFCCTLKTGLAGELNYSKATACLIGRVPLPRDTSKTTNRSGSAVFQASETFESSGSLRIIFASFLNQISPPSLTATCIPSCSAVFHFFFTSVSFFLTSSLALVETSSNGLDLPRLSSGPASLANNWPQIIPGLRLLCKRLLRYDLALTVRRHSVADNNNKRAEQRGPVHTALVSSFFYSVPSVCARYFS